MILLFSNKIAQADFSVPIVYGIEDIFLKDWSGILNSDKIIKLPYTDSPLHLLSSSKSPDFIAISGSSLNDAIEGNNLYPLMPSEKMLEEIYSMPTIIQDALTTAMDSTGRMYGFPNYIDLEAMGYYVPSAWDTSPYTNIDPPSSFEEILDFLEMYLSTPHEGYCFYYDIIGHGTTRWALNTLMRCWALQCNHAGEELVFNQTCFVNLADRTRSLFNQLFSIEKDKKHQKGQQLFTDRYYGYTPNNKGTFTLRNLIPWRAINDQPPLVSVTLELYCCNKDSNYANKASLCFEKIVDHRTDPYNGEPCYRRYLYCHPDWIDIEAYRKLTSKGGQYDFLCFTQEFVDSVWEIDKIAIPTIADDSICLVDSFGQEYEQLMEQFLQNKITAKEFAIQWDSLNHTQP